MNGQGLIHLPAGTAEDLARRTDAEVAALPAGHRARLAAAAAAQHVGRLDAPLGDDGSTLADVVAADGPDALDALHWQLLTEQTAAHDPEAWATGLQQIDRPRGVSRAIYNRLQAA